MSKTVNLAFSALVYMAVAFATSAASPAAIHSLDGDKIEVDVFGQRAVFPKTQAGPIYTDIGTACAGVNWRIPLDEWLNNKATAACIDKKYPTTASSDLVAGLDILVSLKNDHGVISPGNVSASKIPKTLFLPLTILFGPIYYNLSPRPDGKGVWEPAPYGYERLQVAKSPPQYSYRLPAASRIGHVSRPLLVSCEDQGAVVCSIVLRSASGQLLVELSWLRSTVASHAISGPAPDWIDYDQAARAMAASIFPFNPSGDLQ